MKSLMLFFVLTCMTCIANAQIVAVVRLARNSAPYVAISAIRAQSQIQKQQRQIVNEQLRPTNLSQRSGFLTPADSLYIKSIALTFPRVDKTRRKTSGSIKK